MATPASTSSAEDKTYNGWTNYETWRINLEIFDGFFEHVEEEDMQVFKNSTDALADHLKEQAEEAITGYGEIPDDSLAVSYALAFASECNYYEIAEHILEEYKLNKEA